MIKNFLHKGLKNFYLAGITSGIQQVHRKRLQLILTRLDSIYKPEDMNLPGFNFHKLSGQRKDEYTISVNKSWRIVFKFDGIDVYDVDYLNYH